MLVQELDHTHQFGWQLVSDEKHPDPPGSEVGLDGLPVLLGIQPGPQRRDQVLAGLPSLCGGQVHRAAKIGDRPVLHPLPPAVGRAIDRAIGDRTGGPILLNSRDTRMDRHAATRRLRHLADAAGVRIARAHPHMLRHTFVTTMLDAGVDLRDVQIAARHADPRTTMRYDRARKNLDRHPNYILAAYVASGT